MIIIAIYVRSWQWAVCLEVRECELVAIFFAFLSAVLGGFGWDAMLGRVRGLVGLWVGFFRGWLGGNWPRLFGGRVGRRGGDRILLYLVIDRGGRRCEFCVVLCVLTLCRIVMVVWVRVW